VKWYTFAEGDGLKLLRTKVWSWVDIGLLKWSSLLFGMLAGVYLAEVMRPYLVVLLVLAVLCAVKPAVHYFKD
jgi:hypothetical protein